MVSKALETGDHPSVSDNPVGIPATGNMLLARSQDDFTSVHLEIVEADLSYNEARTGERVHTNSFLNSLQNLTDEQKSEFVKIQTNMDADGLSTLFEVTQVNGDVVMAQGRLGEDGVFGADPQTYYKVYENGEAIACPSGADVVTTLSFTWMRLSQYSTTTFVLLQILKPITLTTSLEIIGTPPT